MKKHVLEQQIRTAVEHAAPNQLDSILSSCDQIQNTAGAPVQEQKKGAIIHMSEVKNSKARRRSGLMAIAALAAVFVLCIGGYSLFWNQTAPVSDSIITLDVNPSLSMHVDSNEKVISVEALNEDAKEVLGTMDLKDTSLEVAVNAIIGSMLQKGYLGDLQNSILVSVEDPDAARGEKLQEKVSQAIANALQGGAVDAAILTQSLSANDASLAALAEQYGISMGKAALIQEMIAQDAALTFENLSSMTINEIALIASSKDLSSDAISQSGTASDKAYIRREEALNLACAHAGVAMADIQKYGVEFDSDDGIMIYEVEFETATQKYQYDLNAKTGKILDYEIHIKGNNSQSNSGTNTGTTTPGTGNNSNDSSSTSANSTSYIGEFAAKAAALAHAGVSESDTYYIKCYLDYKNGKPACYCVEFAAGNTEYEYEIDLYSGAVLESETETYHEDSHSSSGKTSETGSTDYIGESAALAAALNHAGVSESSLTKQSVELDKHNNTMVYEVEFETSDCEYEYRIGAVTGAILEAEAHQHH